MPLIEDDDEYRDDTSRKGLPKAKSPRRDFKDYVQLESGGDIFSLN